MTKKNKISCRSYIQQCWRLFRKNAKPILYELYVSDKITDATGAAEVLAMEEFKDLGIEESKFKTNFKNWKSE